MSKERELKFKINESTTLTATKSELQEMIKQFDEPEYKIIKEEGFINLTNGIQDEISYSGINILSDYMNSKTGNLQNLSLTIAQFMEDTLTGEEQRDTKITGYCINFLNLSKTFTGDNSGNHISNKHFKTKEKCLLAIELLNESQDIKDLFAKGDKGSE